MRVKIEDIIPRVEFHVSLRDAVASSARTSLPLSFEELRKRLAISARLDINMLPFELLEFKYESQCNWRLGHSSDEDRFHTGFSATSKLVVHNFHCGGHDLLIVSDDFPNGVFPFERLKARGVDWLCGLAPCPSILVPHPAIAERLSGLRAFRRRWRLRCRFEAAEGPLRRNLGNREALFKQAGNIAERLWSEGALKGAERRENFAVARGVEQGNDLADLGRFTGLTPSDRSNSPSQFRAARS